jgi:diguanylate cyclase (GGDEF)-like protein
MFLLVAGLLTVAYLFSRRMVLQNEAVHEALRQGELQLQRILRFAPLPMLIVRSADERMVYANDHARNQFQIGDTPLTQLQARHFYVNAADRDQLVTAIRDTGSVKDLELQLQDSKGRPFWGLCSSQRIHYEGQDCVLTALVNVDERKRAHDDMSYRAYHDTLTGLPNRAMFMDAFKRTLGRMERNQGAVSFLFIDLDHFKAVNDSLGHEMGDVLLQQVAQRVSSCVREGDLLARLGGDEFVVLVEGQDDPHSMAQKILEVLRPDYDLNGHATKVTASIGISRFPQDGVELNGLLSAADFAMYQAKTTGRDSVQFYKPQS